MLSFAFFITWVLLLASLLGFLGQAHWGFELLAPFRMQYFTLLLVLMLLFGMAGRWLPLFVAVIGIIINGTLIYPSYFHPVTTPKPGTYHPLRLMNLNVSIRNQRYDVVLKAIRAADPDILTLEEVSLPWRNALKRSDWLTRQFPYQYVSGDTQTGVYSKFRLFNKHLEAPNPRYRVDDILHVNFELKGRTVSLRLLHPQHPTSQVQDWRQKVVFAYLISHADRCPQPCIVVGDLNTSPWSHHFVALVRQMRLKDTRLGFGVQPSWPAQWWPFLIPIDHVLVSQDVDVINRYVGNYVGSDHRPVVVDLAI
jgi:endonuclease/exonuclease/phosphatase (EEP) superfamily protein YafD